MRALLLAALLLVTLLAVVPSAEARPDPPECVHGGIEVSVGPVTVRTNCGAPPSISYDPEWCTEQGLC